MGEIQGKKREGRKKKIINTKKFMEFYLVVLHSAERNEARQWIVARQVSCFNPVTLKNGSLLEGPRALTKVVCAVLLE